MQFTDQLTSTANEQTFLHCLVLSLLCCMNLYPIHLTAVRKMKRISKIPFSFIPLPQISPSPYYPHMYSTRTCTRLSYQQQPHQHWANPVDGMAADWWGWKNRRQINWIIRNMQMNSFQFKCRFWHFSWVGWRMSERETEKDDVELPPKIIK